MNRAAVQAAQRFHYYQPRQRSGVYLPPKPPSPVLLAVEPAELALSPAGAVSDASLKLEAGVGIDPEVSAEVDPDATSVSSASASQTEATPDDYTLLLVPLTTGGLAFAVVGAFSDTASGAVWGVAVFLVTIIAMRDEQFSEIAAHLARHLKPPRK